VSLPAPDLTLVALTAWSSVIYNNTSEGSRGRTIASHLPRLNRSGPAFVGVLPSRSTFPFLTSLRA
jgi:hypothetical protein